MKQFKTFLSVMLILMLLFAGLTACSDKKTQEDSSAPTASETESIAPDEIPAQADALTTAATTAAPAATQPSVFPQTKAEWISAFNTALRRRAPQCTAASQKITQGKLWIGNDSSSFMDLLAPEQAELLARFEQENVSGTALMQLSENDVSAVDANEKTVVFTLAGTSANDSISQGKGGYIALIDNARTNELVDSVKAYANVSGQVKISSASHQLSEGTLRVTFNADFSEIQAAEFTAKQNVNAKMRYLIMSINADLNYTITAKFK